MTQDTRSAIVFDDRPGVLILLTKRGGVTVLRAEENGQLIVERVAYGFEEALFARCQQRTPSQSRPSDTDIPVCDGHAESWFCERNHLVGGLDAKCVVCAHQPAPSSTRANDAEQLLVQLAGCSVAALGWNKEPAKEGDYGWSKSYQDVLELRAKYERLQDDYRRLAEATRSAIREKSDG